MISFSLAIHIPKNVLESRVKKANLWLREEVYKDTVQFVPARSGMLAEKNVLRKGTSIVYNSPYARFQYQGKLMVDPETGSSYARKGVRKRVTDKPLKYSTSKHSQATSRWFEASKAVNLEHWEKGVQDILEGKQKT